jgi:hypothetical protein
MTRPALFKYTTYDGAMKIVSNCSIKLSHPSAFNDPFDMSLTEALGAELEEFLPGLQRAFLDFISGDIDYKQLRPGLFQAQIILLNQAIKRLPKEKRDTLSLEYISDSPASIWDIESLRESNRQMVEQIEEQFNDWGIFCASGTRDSLLMWAHYADHHRGAVLEFQGDAVKDSPLIVAKPVRYSKDRPLVCRSGEDLVERSLMAPLLEVTNRILDDLVYTKSPEWQYEEEYRLAIPFFLPKGATDGLFRFYSEELVAIYFGCRMPIQQQAELAKLGKELNS